MERTVLITTSLCKTAHLGRIASHYEFAPHTFCAAPQRVLSREQLLDLSRLHNAEVYDRSIDVQILRLRRKIEADSSQPEYIKTERGAGYVFDTPVAVLY
jgi:DNA-binding response OmpR family regulator